MRTWVDVAELTNTKTLNGGLVARSASGLPFLLSEGMEVAFVPPVLDAPRRARVEGVQPAGNDSYVVQFSGISHIDTASLLVGSHCLVRRADVPKDDLRAYAPLWDGWSVRDIRAGHVGKVEGVEDRAVQPLLLVRVPAEDGEGDVREGRQVLIPLVEEFLVDVNEEALCITVDVPAGLLDL